MEVAIKENRQAWGAGARIFLCFSFASAGWICWLYRLTELAGTPTSDALSLVLGYAMQAMGVGAFLVMGRRYPATRLRHAASISCLLYVALLIPAVLVDALMPALVFGCAANAFYGVFAAEYLRVLATRVDESQRATVFGVSYAASTVAAWACSLPAGGALTRGAGGLAVCCALAMPLAVLMWRRVPARPEEAPHAPVAQPDVPIRKDPTVLLAAACIVLLSLVKNMGYSLPTADISDGVSLELSRVLYGVGLVLAGLTTDRNRRVGALCCFCALIMPFLSLSLTGSNAPAMLVWSVDYLLFGFFSVYRVVLAVDLCANRSQHHMAGAGLMLGRIGDAAGTGICLALAHLPLVLTCLTAALFALAAMVFFLLYQRLYLPVTPHEYSEEELFELFAARHDLTAREGEVLQLVLEDRSNTQIATELCVSQNTVKYHVRNLLKKTGCKSKREIRTCYLASKAS